MPEYTISNYRAICLSSNSPFVITLWSRAGSDNKSFDVGRAWFMPDDQTMPPANIDPDGRINIYYRQSAFSTILELLRNEKPVQLFFESNSEAGLRTVSAGSAAEDKCLQALFSRPGSTTLSME